MKGLIAFQHNSEAEGGLFVAVFIAVVLASRHGWTVSRHAIVLPNGVVDPGAWQMRDKELGRN